MSYRNHLLWLGGALLIGTAVAVSQPSTPYAATETPLGVENPGTVTYPGGNTHIRDFVVRYNRTSSEPRVNGPVRFVMNFNLDANLSGRIWGTARLEVGGGAWEGTFQGTTNRLTGIAHYKSVWHGSGDLSGMQIKETCVYTGTPVGTCTGRILAAPPE